jgi:hypothetical protein
LSSCSWPRSHRVQCRENTWLRQAVEKRVREELAKLKVEVNEEKSRKVDRLPYGERLGSRQRNNSDGCRICARKRLGRTVIKIPATSVRRPFATLALQRPFRIHGTSLKIGLGAGLRFISTAIRASGCHWSYRFPAVASFPISSSEMIAVWTLTGRNERYLPAVHMS